MSSALDWFHARRLRMLQLKYGGQPFDEDEGAHLVFDEFRSIAAKLVYNAHAENEQKRYRNFWQFWSGSEIDAQR